MIPVRVFAQDPEALKRWLGLKEVKLTPCFSLYNLTQEASSNTKGILLIHYTSNTLLKEIKPLIQQGFQIIIFSNNPSSEEGAQLFKLGIKGYLNTYATLDKIQQAIKTVHRGHVWLGQVVLSAMIQAIPAVNSPSEGWKALLSKKEKKTALEILKGKTNLQIAKTLGIKEGSIKSKITKILQKLGAKDRLDLVLKIQNWQD